MGKYRLQRASGKAFIPPDQLSIEAVRDHWHQISDFSVNTYPNSIHGKDDTGAQIGSTFDFNDFMIRMSWI